MVRDTFVKRGVTIFALACGLFVSGNLHGLAATETVSLKRLHIRDVILLPTISSQYETNFTRPLTWQVQNGSVNLEFQHSIELLPNRSWLQVIVNDKVIKHIPLTRENAEGTKMTIPLPVALLKDFNTLTFRVTQHYTDHCEDPLDKSLWTQILPATRLVFNYAQVAPRVNLDAYPYPIIDPLTYSPARIRYITSRSGSEKEMLAMAMVNTHLAQQAQTHEMESRVAFSETGGPDDEHIIFVGKGASIPDAGRYQNIFGAYALQNGQWVNRTTGQPVPSDQGLILFAQAPGSKSHTVLVVSGNSDEAVLKAAQYLTLRPRETALSGSEKTVGGEWNPPGVRTSRTPRFIESQTRTFRDLGFNIEEVHKINAPPITYRVPVVTRFHQTNGRLWLDLVYGYSPQLNPQFSSLELRMNDISLANIPLTNPAGESMVRASIPVASELIRPRNELVAQFHLMPDKYGWCVDNYVDNAWGKIMDDSQFRVEGAPASYLPDLGLLNAAMYPYSREDNLEHVQFVVPSDPSAELLDAMLAFTTRLGRATMADTDLRLTLSRGDTIGGDKNAVIFRSASDRMKLPDGARLIWQSGGGLLKRLTLPDPVSGKIAGDFAELGGDAYMEQYALGGERMVSVFTAPTPEGFLTLGHFLENDALFERLDMGRIQQASLFNPNLNAVTETVYHAEQKGTGVPVGAWDSAVAWLKGLPWDKVIIGMVGLFFLLIGLPLIMRAFRRNR